MLSEITSIATVRREACGGLDIEKKILSRGLRRSRRIRTTAVVQVRPPEIVHVGPKRNT